MMMGLRFIWTSKFFFSAWLLRWSCFEVVLLTVLVGSAEAKPLVYEHAAAVKRLNK
jgi:hypothetical protein